MVLRVLIICLFVTAPFFEAAAETFCWFCPRTKAQKKEWIETRGIKRIRDIEQYLGLKALTYFSLNDLENLDCLLVSYENLFELPSNWLGKKVCLEAYLGHEKKDYLIFYEKAPEPKSKKYPFGIIIKEFNQEIWEDFHLFPNTIPILLVGTPSKEMWEKRDAECWFGPHVSDGKIVCYPFFKNVHFEDAEFYLIKD